MQFSRFAPAFLCGSLLLGACAVSNDENARINDVVGPNSMTQSVNSKAAAATDSLSDVTVPASADTFANFGVLNWRITEADSNTAYLVEGLDVDGGVVSTTIMRVLMDAAGNPQSVSYEHSLPFSEFASMSLDGKTVDGALSDLGAALLNAISADISPAMEDGTIPGGNERHTCLWITLGMIGVCGGVVAACILSGGNPAICLVGAGACMVWFTWWFQQCRP